MCPLTLCMCVSLCMYGEASQSGHIKSEIAVDVALSIHRQIEWIAWGISSIIILSHNVCSDAVFTIWNFNIRFVVFSCFHFYCQNCHLWNLFKTQTFAIVISLCAKSTIKKRNKVAFTKHSIFLDKTNESEWKKKRKEGRMNDSWLSFTITFNYNKTGRLGSGKISIKRLLRICGPILSIL